MKHLFELPTLEKIEIEYSKKVYSPAHTSVDTVVVADALIRKGHKDDLTVLDLGCGSGVLGLSIKYLHPLSKVTLVDSSLDAIKITKKNALSLGLDVKVKKSNLLDSVDKFDMIICNLPTYDDEQIDDTIGLPLYGPKMAYYGPGIELYKKVLDSDKTNLLVCECQKKYQEQLKRAAEWRGWMEIIKTDFAFAFLRKPKILV